MDDQENLANLSIYRKWLIALTIYISVVLITCTSTVWSLTLAKKLTTPQFVLSLVPKKIRSLSPSIAASSIAMYTVGVIEGATFSGFKVDSNPEIADLYDVSGRTLLFNSLRFQKILKEILSVLCMKLGPVSLAIRRSAGYYGFAYISTAPGTFFDLFGIAGQHKQHAWALILYSVTPVIGIGLGVFILHAIINKKISSWWPMMVLIIFSILMWLQSFFSVVYELILLEEKARRIRVLTVDQPYYAPEIDRCTTEENLFTLFLIQVIFQHQMISACCFYAGFTLALSYCFKTFPDMFANIYDIDPRDLAKAFILAIVYTQGKETISYLGFTFVKALCLILIGGYCLWSSLIYFNFMLAQASWQKEMLSRRFRKRASLIILSLFFIRELLRLFVMFLGSLIFICLLLQNWIEKLN